MGEPKLLLPWGDDGRSLIEHVLTLWKQSRVTTVVVTVHPDDAQLAERCRSCGAEVVVAAKPPVDMKASVAVALEFVRARFSPNQNAGDVWLVAPADVPGLAPTVVDHLLDAYDARRPTILRPVHNGRGGHPLLLPWSAADEVSRLPADRGLKDLCERLPTVDLEVGPACLAADVDTPDDYRRLRDR